jgi:Holliday junction resolvase RusA-like endonuclease
MSVSRETITVDIPVPPSVNRTRRLDRSSMRTVEAWKRAADLAITANGQFRAAGRLARRACDEFEITIVLNEAMCRQDLDNPIKAAIDYLRRIELISDDGPRQLRRIVVGWGEAPAGCRMIVKGLA